MKKIICFITAFIILLGNVQTEAFAAVYNFKVGLHYDGTQTDDTGVNLQEIVNAAVFDKYEDQFIEKKIAEEKEESHNKIESVRVDYNTFIIAYYTHDENVYNLLQKTNTLDFVYDEEAQQALLKPRILVPLFCTVKGEERVFGYFDIYFRGYEQEYLGTLTRFYMPPEFLEGEGEPITFLENMLTMEKVRETCRKLGLNDVKNALLIKNPLDIPLGSGYCLFVENNEGIFVYDFMNTVGADTDEHRIYTLDEYYSLRTEYEKNNCHIIEFKGNTASPIIGEVPKTNLGIYIIVLSLVAVASVCGVCVVVKKRKSKKNQTNSIE